MKQPKPFKGIFPTVKSWFFGDSFQDIAYDEQQTYVNATGDTESWWKIIAATHTFGRQALKTLVDIGYTNSPAGFGIINKITLAQRNIIFKPYWNGRPYKIKGPTVPFDINFGLYNLLTTGTCIVYEKEIVGFGYKLTVLNTLDIEEVYNGNSFTYRYYKNDGTFTILENDRMIFIKIFDPGRRNTQMGLSPFQAALMPIESLKYMYIADASTLKNKGVDVLITNDSDTPLAGVEPAEMDKALNDRIRGANKSGGVATSTSKLRVLQLGRTAKELALWDGYKIKLRDLCNVYQVDSGQFNDPDNKKFSNVEESNRALYNDCVIPFTRLITENPQLVERVGYEIFLDTSGIDCLQIAQNVRAEKAKTTTEAIVGLNEDVKNKIISVDIAVKILVSEWGFAEEEARGYILIPSTTTEPELPA
jgi:hypothetical protein